MRSFIDEIIPGRESEFSASRARFGGTRQLQAHLRKLLHLPLAIDGDKGPKTKLAMQAFEKNVGPLSRIGWIARKNPRPLVLTLDNFDFNLSNIKFEHQRRLCRFIKSTLWKRLGNSYNDKLLIIGHTDKSGTKNYNQQLSLARADEVKRHFNSMFLCAKVPGRPGSFTPQSFGMGEEFPLSSASKDPKSRRVDLVFLKIR